MRVLNTYIIDNDIVDRIFTGNKSEAQSDATELFECEGRRWFIRTGALRSIAEKEAKKMLEEQKKVTGIKDPFPHSGNNDQPYGD